MTLSKRNCFVVGVSCVLLAAITLFVSVLLRLALLGLLSENNLNINELSSLTFTILSLKVLFVFFLLVGLLFFLMRFTNFKPRALAIFLAILVFGLVFLLASAWVHSARDTKRVEIYEQDTDRVVEALYFAEDIPRGTYLQNKHFKVVNVQLSSLPQSYVAASNQTEVEGRAVVNTVRAHTPVMWFLVGPPPTTSRPAESPGFHEVEDEGAIPTN